MPVRERKRVREVVLSETLNMPIEKVFEIIPIPDNKYELAARINKKKDLGLDCSLEESIRKTRLVEVEINRVKAVLASDVELKSEHVEYLTGILQGVINGLQPKA